MIELVILFAGIGLMAYGCWEAARPGASVASAGVVLLGSAVTAVALIALVIRGLHAAFAGS